MSVRNTKELFAQMKHLYSEAGPSKADKLASTHGKGEVTGVGDAKAQSARDGGEGVGDVGGSKGFAVGLVCEERNVFDESGP